MKAYIRYYAIASCALVATFALWCAAAYWANTYWRAEYHEFIETKAHLASEITKPKVIISSGSNGLFGISAETLTEMGIPAFNFGLTAGLSPYVLRIADAIARSGDVILAPLEYEMYENTHIEEVVYTIEYDTDYFFRRVGAAQAALVFLKEGALFHATITRLGGVAKHEVAEWTQINPYGDILSNDGCVLDPAHPPAPSHTLVTPGAVSAAALENIAEFIDRCRARGVTFIATYPSRLYDKAYDSEVTRRNVAIIEEFYAGKGVPMLGSFEEFLYPMEDMYDTAYHLNARGREERTRVLAGYLREALGR
ncbi:MAG: SGNH/GDSL hydrolase family protein [Synergistaceae bacterium]|jgi:hypothetical protein|nr:SGNH/GDSL hydrolase family protein [Synergistaceae bacterium]